MPKASFAYTLAELRNAAAWLLSQVDERRVLAFYGAMGAGKTTLIKELCRALHVTDNVTSPTFALINEYHTAVGGKVFHFDFYRIKKLEEAYDLGCEEYFDSGHLCLVEWAELVEELLPPDALRIRIETPNANARTLLLYADN
ncbi:MAG: tRNA (adenosine(37)-N6)-threonylcarbamoyltransferase complex ATPase subunit type 1 TsaE [Prevotellaceae bacterium]|jgi:tRNA threonylcarbamoyladenosine biosynthesis protein TsaE|nr:tRNA (adenosine(37)-N6)-threonylcarbamoyltransferase complex ATPase subunit type 1 TsaE [Prevotellaceae bacterium]